MESDTSGDGSFLADAGWGWGPYRILAASVFSYRVPRATSKSWLVGEVSGGALLHVRLEVLHHGPDEAHHLASHGNDGHLVGFLVGESVVETVEA